MIGYCFSLAIATSIALMTISLDSNLQAWRAVNDGVSWRAEFTSSHDWQTLDLPLDEFIPVFRGRRVPSAGPVDPSSIRQVGFLLADKQPGLFALDIRSIEFVSTEDPGSRH